MGKYFKDSKTKVASISDLDVDYIVYKNIKTAQLGTALKSLGKSVLDLPVGLIKKLLPHRLGPSGSKIGGGALTYSSGSAFHPLKEIIDLIPNFGLSKVIDKVATIESLLPGPIRNTLDKPVILQSAQKVIHPKTGKVVTIYQDVQKPMREILEHMRTKGSGSLPDNLQWAPGSQKEFINDTKWLDDAAAKWARTKGMVGLGLIGGGNAIANLMRGGAPSLGIEPSEGIIKADEYLEDINKENIPSGPSSYQQEFEQDPLAKYR